MKAGCRDLERALSAGEPALFAALEAHARDCAACASEIAEWRSISEAARALRRSWSSPELWPRIRQRLAEESRAGAVPVSPRTRPWLRLMPAAAIVSLFAIATAGLFVFRNSGGRDPLTTHWQTTRDPILAEEAIGEVEDAEKSYIESIDRLSRLARPRLERAGSPVIANYREKLDVLDSAIAELKSSIEENRFNTHLRRELLAVYREKQQTLQNLMREVQS